MRRGGPGRAGLRTLLSAALVLPLLAGCGLTHLADLNFRVDDRLHFTGPEDRSLVQAPFTVRWTMRDFRVAAPGSEPPSDDAGYFGVFVDQAPVKPGQTLDAVASGDTYCEQDPKCPDRAYLRDRQVYETTEPTLRLGRVDTLTNDKSDVQLHAITVVLLDTAGHRIGESAWELDVRMHRVGF
jgi:hypothetical protein